MVSKLKNQRDWNCLIEMMILFVLHGSNPMSHNDNVTLKKMSVEESAKGQMIHHLHYGNNG